LETGLSEEEREAIRNELRDRFQPGARAIPTTLQGLSSLANERIEEAMARGQFKNLPRGKGKHVERDHIANNPYLDTTEYLMNRILQKQQATPEWIQKQQEVRLEITRFRSQLREDWRRHAARVIASQGGSLETQIIRATAYAAAEARRVDAANNKKLYAEENGRATAEDDSRTQLGEEGRIKRLSISSPDQHGQTNTSSSTPSSSDEPLPIVSPLRDPQYLSIEYEYHTLTIKKLNEQIRSYNLQAPQLSQRGYLTLERELENCYAEVAPSLPEEVRRRATEKAHDHTVPISRDGETSGLQQTFGLAQKVQVYEEDSKKGYGFKQFWRDIWNSRIST
jgi:hypothetical protein